MKSVTETIFLDSGIAPELFGKYAIQIGDKDWWDMVGIEPPSLADNRSGMVCIKAGRLIALVAGILKAWNVSDDDALVLLGGTSRTSFGTNIDRACMVLFASAYSILAYSCEINSSNTWFHRPCVFWDGATPLAVMLNDAGGLLDVFGYLETAVSPVTYFTAEHDD